MSGFGTQRLMRTKTLPSVLHSGLQEDNCFAVESLPSLNSDLTLTVNRNITLTLHLTLTLTQIIHLTRTVAWALNSVLEGDHETGVDSLLLTSLDLTQTLGKALSPSGPNSKSDNSMHTVSRICTEILDMECGTSLSHFKSATAAERDES